MGLRLKIVTAGADQIRRERLFQSLRPWHDR